MRRLTLLNDSALFAVIHRSLNPQILLRERLNQLEVELFYLPVPTGLETLIEAIPRLFLGLTEESLSEIGIAIFNMTLKHHLEIFPCQFSRGAALHEVMVKTMGNEDIGFVIPINETRITVSGFFRLHGHDLILTKSVHLFFHSTGGFVGDGMALYNYFRALPVDLTLYNPGVIASIGVIAYLGAPHRMASAHSVFMIHRTQCNIPPGTTALRAQTIVNSALLDDQRTEVILKDRLTLPAEKWKHFENDDLHFSADEAVKYGIADKIADFSPPTGRQIYNI
jgi:ATP-dependent Clp protease, protease subunit